MEKKIWVKPGHNCLIVSLSGEQTYEKIFDANGKLICHSRSRGETELREIVQPGQYVVEADGEVTKIRSEFIDLEAKTKRTIAEDKVAAEGIKMHAVVSAAIAEADGATGQDTSKGSGIKTGHIQNDAIGEDKIRINAITSSKIKEADGISGQDTNRGCGIKTNHIQNDAITSNKIKEADSTTGQNIDRGCGIKSGHIQNGAITSSKIRNADGSLDATADHGIKTAHLNDGTVTSTKLSVVDPAGTITGTFGSNESPDLEMEDNPVVEFSGSEFDKIRIPQVMPTTSGVRLSWSFQVQTTSEKKMRYYFSIKKDAKGVSGYLIRFVKLN